MSQGKPAVSDEVDVTGDEAGIARAGVESFDLHLVTVLLQDVLDDSGGGEGLIPAVEGTDGDLVVIISLHGRGVLGSGPRGAVGPLRVDVVGARVGAAGLSVSAVGGTASGQGQSPNHQGGGRGDGLASNHTCAHRYSLVFTYVHVLHGTQSPLLCSAILCAQLARCARASGVRLASPLVMRSR